MLPGAEGMLDENIVCTESDHQQARFDFLMWSRMRSRKVLAKHQQNRRFNAEPFRAHFDLALRFFAGNVEASDAFFG